MTVTARLPRGRVLGLCLATLAIYAVEIFVVPRLASTAPPRLVASAMAFDLSVVVPFAWWLFVLRGRPNALRRAVSMGIVSLGLAALFAPSGGRELLRLVRFAFLPGEVVVLYLSVRAVISAVRLARADVDVSEALESGLTRTFGENPVARFLSAEASAVFHAVLPRRRKAPSPTSFSLSNARSPALAWGLSFATIIEGAVLHLIFGHSHPVIAWSLTAVSAYAIVWLVGQDRALAARTIETSGDHLVLRAGLRLSAKIPWNSIASVDLVSWSSQPARSREHFDATRPAEANVVVRFRSPVTVSALFGMPRTVTSIGLSVDEPEALRAAILDSRDRE